MIVKYKNAVGKGAGEADTRDKGYITVEWEALRPGDIGEALEIALGAYVCVQTSGTFGSGGYVGFRGGIIDANQLLPMVDKSGNEIKITKASMVEMGLRVRFLQPYFQSNTPAAMVNVYLFATR